MKYFWRVQQSQMVISIIFWSLTLTGVFYDKVREWSNNFWILPEDSVFLGMLVMFCFVVLAIILFGVIYDRLQFWKEQQLVIVERNPYASWKPNPVQSMWIELMVDMIREMAPENEALQEKAELYAKWLKNCEGTDPWYKKARNNIRKFAVDGDDSIFKSYTGDVHSQ
jgi:hypothetical protein